MGLLKIAVAGILAIPSLLIMVVTAPFVALLSIPSLFLLCFRSSDAATENDTDASKKLEEHAVISGGSSGIGLSIAQDCVGRNFARVTIVARNQTKLERAVQALEKFKTTTKSQTIIQYKSVDVSNATALKTMAQEVLGKKEDNNSTKVYLFCCAGVAHPSYFEHLSSATFAQLVATNQLGTIYTVQAFLPLMTNGTIVFTSSVAGQIGVYGYTAYAPTKFALRGFAEALHAELCDSNIHVQVAFPPDTDTPGFQEEEKLKPLETKLISEQAGLSDAKDIASGMVTAAQQPNPPFLVWFTFEGWMVAALTAGMSPVSTLSDALAQVVLMSLFRFVSLFYLNDWWRMIRNASNERRKAGKKKQRPQELSTQNSASSNSSLKKD